MPQDKKRLKNLPQFKKMSDEEFDNYFENYKSKPSEDVETRIEKSIEDFSKNYDLRDLNINDTLSIRELAKLFVLLDDLGVIEQQALEDGEVNKLKSLSAIKKEYLDSAAKLQEILNISRRSRQTDVEDLSAYLPAILKKAKNFLSQRLAYIYCPDCRMLVANVWFNNWEKDNKLSFVCSREECSHEFSVTSSYLAEHRNKNIEGVLNV